METTNKIYLYETDHKKISHPEVAKIKDLTDHNGADSMVELAAILAKKELNITKKNIDITESGY